jgi:hypothetical protein
MTPEQHTQAAQDELRAAADDLIAQVNKAAAACKPFKGPEGAAAIVRLQRAFEDVVGIAIQADA